MIRHIYILCSLLILTGCAIETTSEAEQENQQFIYQEGHLQGFDYISREPKEEVIIYSDFLLSKPAAAASTGDKVLLVKRVRQAVYIESTDGVIGWVSVKNVKEMNDMFPEETIERPNGRREQNRIRE